MEPIELIEDIVAGYTAGAERHRLTVDAPTALRGEWDELRLRQLFTNLMENAIKYSPQGGVVSIKVREIDDEVAIDVADTGVGIAIEEQEHLFDLFSRGEETDDIAGFGLGLYICRAIAEAHSGRIDVASTPGQGSTFRVVLPRVSPNRNSPD